MATKPGYGVVEWERVTSVRVIDLAVGDICIRPSCGTAYHVRADGTVAGVGWQPLDGLMWTVVARDGAAVTGRTAGGDERTEIPPWHATVLRVG